MMRFKMKRTVRLYGDPALRQKAQPVAEVDDRIRRLAREMIEVMRAAKGVGLAAEQVGENVAMFVLEVPLEYDRDPAGQFYNPGVTMPMVFINPQIVKTSAETEVAEEGCLSFPGIYVPIARPVEVTVNFMDLRGESRVQTFRKFIARAIQHEMDHLNGVLLVDRMTPVKKLALAGALRRIKRQGRANSRAPAVAAAS